MKIQRQDISFPIESKDEDCIRRGWEEWAFMLELGRAGPTAMSKDCCG